jgi:hypothetical protein
MKKLTGEPFDDRGRHHQQGDDQQDPDHLHGHGHGQRKGDEEGHRPIVRPGDQPRAGSASHDAVKAVTASPVRSANFMEAIRRTRPPVW